MKKLYIICFIIITCFFINGCCKAKRKNTVSNKENFEFATGFEKNNDNKVQDDIKNFNPPEISSTSKNFSGISSDFDLNSFSNDKFLTAMEYFNKEQHTNAEYHIKNVMSKNRKDTAVQMQGNFLLAEIYKKRNDEKKYKEYMDTFLEQMYKLGNSDDFVKVSNIMNENQLFIENSFDSNNLNDIGIPDKKSLSELHENNSEK